MKHEKIEELTKKMLACGYHDDQIKHILRDTIENNLDDDGSLQEKLIIDVLESYIEFGTKCKQGIK
ncbi:hypothetical protein SOV_26060 [Sporomusa ovata DSM 2662]|uniref:Uncharacterized protein n=1 Tax=Sporomusa ovata TaxID=2378 RepID=A0A0U1L490_9FIRM|nr:hypothetical protein [Sporomusa ovata]EQB25919.1 hypothetical protein SOV_4c05860 [Sporomusa ovata DSM 2662]CQR74498.1 hypothetical protein SpAn4DRAFT_0960 [Sporomusa ovata]